MQEPKVVIVGHVCIDHNKTEQAVYTNWGSGTLYMGSYAQTHLGLQPAVITTYGEDFAPYRDTFNILPGQPQAKHTLVFENIIKEGTRTRYCHHTETATPPELTPEMKQALAEADIVILATLLSNYSIDYVQQLLNETRPECFKVCCPQGYFRQIDNAGKVSPRDFPEAKELLSLFDLTVLSELDHPRATELAQSWKRAGCSSIIILTQAENGANVLTDSDKLQHMPTEPLAESDIIDSVGAGDVFAMALAYNYRTSRDILVAVQAAHQAAREKLLTTPQK